jgi:hypothetical protein
MISIENCRKELGKPAEGMSDERVKEVRDSIERFVEIALDDYFDSFDKK